MAELALCYENCGRTYSRLRKLWLNLFSVTEMVAELIFRYEYCGRTYSRLRKLWANLFSVTEIVAELFGAYQIVAELIFESAY